MKKMMIALFILGMCIPLSLGAMRTLDQIDTNRREARNVEEAVQVPWTTMRVVDDANDTALTSATKVWTGIDDEDLFYELPPDARVFSIAAYGHGDGATDANDPNGGSFNYKVYAVKRYGSAQLVCQGAWAVGELELSSNPENGVSLGASENYKWCELPTVTYFWPMAVVAGGTTDDVGTINFDPLGYYGVRVEVTDMADVNDVTICCSWTN